MMSKSEFHNYHEREAARLRSLLAVATTRWGRRLLGLAGRLQVARDGDRVRLCRDSVPGTRPVGHRLSTLAAARNGSRDFRTLHSCTSLA